MGVSVDEVRSGVGRLRLVHRLGASGILTRYSFASDCCTVLLDEPHAVLEAPRDAFTPVRINLEP